MLLPCLLAFTLLPAPSSASPAQRGTPVEPTVQNLGLAVPTSGSLLDARGSDELQAFRVSESAQGRDLNGDADAVDHVLFAAHTRTGRVRNLAFAVNTEDYNLRFRVSGPHLISRSPGGLVHYDASRDLQIERVSAGPFFDLADGILAHVRNEGGTWHELHVVDLWAGSETVLESGRTNRLACSSRLVMFDVPETDAGDLNGDGDALDFVVHAYDVRERTVTNLGLAMGHPSNDASLRASGGTATFLASEVEQGSDLNGDGDALDYVPVVYRADGASATALARSVSPVQPSAWEPVTSYQLLGEDLLTFSFQESALDFNGDGDTADLVLELHALTPGGQPSWVVAQLAGRSPTSGRVALAVSEFYQGQTVLNGDGDVGDSVAHLYDPTTGQLENLGLANVGLRWDRGASLAILVPEVGQGRVDRNGDGDIHDQVWSLRTPLGLVRETGLGGTCHELGPGKFLVDAFESLGVEDLNGDGDLVDRLLVVWDARLGRSAVVDLPVVAVGPRSPGSALFTVSEAQAARDLNGDGDTNDAVLHRLGL